MLRIEKASTAVANEMPIRNAKQSREPFKQLHVGLFKHAARNRLTGKSLLDALTLPMVR